MAERDTRKADEELHLRAAKQHGERLTGVERRVDVVEERVEGFDKITEPRLVPSVPRPTVRSQRAAQPVDATEAMRQVSESRQEIDATIAAIGRSMGDLAAEQRTARIQTAQALVVLARELSAEEKLPAAIRASIPPPRLPSMSAPAERPPMLARIDKRSTRSFVLELVVATSTLLYVLDHLIRHVVSLLH